MEWRKGERHSHPRQMCAGASSHWLESNAPWQEKGGRVEKKKKKRVNVQYVGENERCTGSLYLQWFVSGDMSFGSCILIKIFICLPSAIII